MGSSTSLKLFQKNSILANQKCPWKCFQRQSSSKGKNDKMIFAFLSLKTKWPSVSLEHFNQNIRIEQWPYLLENSFINYNYLSGCQWPSLIDRLSNIKSKNFKCEILRFWTFALQWFFELPLTFCFIICLWDDCSRLIYSTVLLNRKALTAVDV